MKKFLSILLTVSMLLSLSLTAFADEGDVTAEPPAEAAEPETVQAAEVPAEEEEPPAPEEEPAPVEEPTADPEEQPAEEPAEEAEEEPAAEPAAEEPAVEPVAAAAEIAPIFVNDPDQEIKDVQDPDEREDPSTDKDKEGLGVWLHVVNGNFTGDYAKQSSVWVDFQEGGERKLPADMDPYKPIRTNGTFLGWYTQAPTETHVTTDTYDVWKTEAVNGQVVPAGGTVPEGVQTLYAAFKDKEEVQEEDKLVTYYLDWNGIGGMWGHCLTSTRKFEASVDGYALKAEDLLVRYLNWNGETKSFSSMEDLTKYWESTDFDGYTFKGWATTPGASTPDVKVGHVVKSGDSLYAVWTKGGSQSKDFDRTDPAAGAVKGLRLEGVSGSHTTGTMTWSAHESTGSSLQFSAATTEPRATFKALIWTVSDGKQSVEVSYEPQKAGAVSGSKTLGDVKLTATGKTLTIEYTGANDNAAPVSLSVNVSAVNEDGSVVKASNIDATAIFTHSWKEQSKTEAKTCGDYSVTEYSCAVDGCGATRETKVRLEHVYNSLVASGVVILKEPSCTEPGEKQLKCLRCGALKDDGAKYSIAALGHEWTTTYEAADCSHDYINKTCGRCGLVESSLTDASHPELHKWKTTGTYSVTCLTSEEHQRCETCGAYRTFTVSANNPDRHNFQDYMRQALDCGREIVWQKCVTCGRVQQAGIIKSGYTSIPHTWGAWRTSKAPTTSMPGEQTRTCAICGAKETMLLPAIKQPDSFAPVQTPDLSGAQSGSVPAAGWGGTAGASTYQMAYSTGSAGFTRSLLTAVTPDSAAKAPAAPVNRVYARSTAASGEHKAAVSNYAMGSPELTGAQSAEDGITVSWNKVDGAALYRVFCKADGGSWVKLADTGDTSYTWTDAQEGGNYSFTVRCVSADGRSYTSSYDAAGLAVANSLAVPELIRSRNVSGGILLSWSQVDGADKYQVLCKADGGSWVKLTETADSSYTWKGSETGTGYSFTVRGVSSEGGAPVSLSAGK